MYKIDDPNTLLKRALFFLRIVPNRLSDGSFLAYLDALRFLKHHWFGRPLTPTEIQAVYLPVWSVDAEVQVQASYSRQVPFEPLLISSQSKPFDTEWDFCMYAKRTTSFVKRI
jgi:hypothetical protein